MRTRLRVWKGDTEITEHIERGGGQALPGWSSSVLLYIPKDHTGHPSAPERVGFLVAGSPCAIADGFRVEEEDAPDADVHLSL